jgi:hypothetical protein
MKVKSGVVKGDGSDTKLVRIDSVNEECGSYIRVLLSFFPPLSHRLQTQLSCMMMQKHGCCGNGFLGEGERGTQCKICHHLICSSRRSRGKRERDFSCNGD